MISFKNIKNENLINKLNLKYTYLIDYNKFIKNISKSILINIQYYNWNKWKSIKWNNMKLLKNNNNQLNNKKSIKSCSYNYFKIYFLLLLVLLNFNKVLCEVCSSLPAVPVNAKLVEITRESDNVIAKYKCDSGYELLGSSTINCHPKKGWEIQQLPLCGVNIGFGKPVNQSSYTRTGLAYFSNDGKPGDQNPDKQECSETQKEVSPWWQVDLLMAAEVKAVRIRTKSCCGSQQLQDLEIRVGNSSNDLQRNPLCAWYPGVLDEGIAKTFLCARKLIGQYVYIQMVGIEGSLSLCEVEVFTNSELSTEKCIGSKSSVEALTATFSNTCYDFYFTKGKNFKEADNMCKLLGGNLIQELNYDKTTYIISLLERKKEDLKTQLVWIGAEKEPGLTSRTWKWLNGKVISKPSWGKDQPNNYNGEQNCVVLDGGRNWLWNDVGCNLDYLHFICEYDPFSCGSPDIHQNTTVSGKDYSVGKSITYSCPTGFALLGSEKRTCTTRGIWNGTAPTCKYIDCGALLPIENGNIKLSDDRTSYGAISIYKCNDNFTLFGNPNRTCLLNGWSGDLPKCLSDLCADPPNINGGTVKINGKRAGASAEYSCDSGHVLVGEMILKCELGGDWSSKPPTCKYVDCGQPPRPDRGNILFLSNATTIGSKVKYECDQDYWLIGNDETFCTDQGKWSGNSPICELISCDTPKVSTGSFVVGYDYNVHSSIEYKCDPGYILRGNPYLQCNGNGEWDGEPPECEYVDCGKIKAITNGKIEYLQNTTTILSEVLISCSGTHRMIGNRKLVCLESGEWSDEIPKCEEIRCPEPKLAEHSILSITGNDRMYGRTLVKTANTSYSNTQTYKVGALAKYSCERGYKIIGDPLITCDNGKWSGTIPECVFVDCGKPDLISNGKSVLSTNATYLGAVVLYECDRNYKLHGISRRICINNGTWNGETPTCNKITCPDPDLKDMLVPLSVSNDIGGQFKFKCVKGRTLMGNDTKICLKNGEWSGKTPICKAIDCGKPSTIENGRVIIVNDTTTYGATAEYHCIPNYHRSGQYLRKCLETGKWSGDEPKCELTITESSKGSNLGTGIAIGAAIILILLIIIALIFLQRNKVRPVKNTENIQAAERMEDRSAAVMSYSTLEGRNHNNHPSTLENLYDQIPNEQEYNSPYEMRINEEVYEPEPLKSAITINGITVR